MNATRIARLDTVTRPPMVYLVAQGCPKLLEGHAFHACECYGPAVPEQDKPSIKVSCEFLRGQDREVRGAWVTARTIRCGYGGAPNPGNGVQFGVPTVSHYGHEENCGSDKD